VAFLSDVRFGLRRFRREPLLTAVVVLTLGFGTGANAAIFSFVNALLLRPYAFRDLERLVTLWERHPQQGGQAALRPSDPGHALAPGDLLDLRAQSKSFLGLAAMRHREFTLVGQGEPERFMGVLVSPELFGLLGVEAALGRTLKPEEAQPGHDGVAVISHGLWQRRLGGAPDVLGRTLTLNGRPHTLVGVMPPELDYPPGGVELWAPLAFGEKDRQERAALSLRALGRLRPGVPLGQARAELLQIAERLERAYPHTNAGRTFHPVLLREQQAGLTAPFALLLQAAALLVLAIACANVGGVLLARGLERRREMALRAALGAGRSRMARQLLAESLTLSALGGVAAIGLAALGVQVIRNGVPRDITKWVAGWGQIKLDERTLAFGLLTVVATAFVTGLFPLLGAARVSLVSLLRETGRGATPGRRGGRALVVVAQMALALVLLSGAVLMLRGFARLSDRYAGLDPERVLTFRVRLPDWRYAPGRPTGDFYARLLAELRGVSSLESAAVVGHLPGDLGPVPGGPVSIRGRSAPGDLDLPTADYQPASADYFRALGTRLLEGRGFTAADGVDAPAVAIVSRSMARRLWPDGSALGRQLKQGRPDGPGPWREVVGVVDDVTQYWFDREPRSTLYLPFEQAPRASMFVVLRTAAEPAAVVTSVRARVAALDPELPLDEVRSLRRVVDDGMAFLRLAGLLLWVLGGVALALAALGVYGVVAQDVARRTPEIGVRLALGAAPRQVRAGVLRQALLLAAIALCLGVPLALALGRLMAGALFGIVRPEPWSLAAFAGSLLLVALLAAALPARRAAALDPVVALRRE
jgi:putative ABC transport system permease protein